MTVEPFLNEARRSRGSNVISGGNQMATAISPETKRPKIRQTKMLINGKWVESSGGISFTTLDPATEQVLAEVPLGNKSDVDQAVTAGTKALYEGPWSRIDARERGRLLFKLADLIEENIDELAALETLDNGKPLRDARNADLPLVIDTFRYFAGWADKIHGETIPIRGNYFCYTRREPVGVCGQIIPWNFPLLMLAWKWAPALAAGCVSILKPAEQTPLTALCVGELALEAGFPPGVVQIITGDGTTGDALVRHPGIDKIAFTGEYKTAQIIMANAASRSRDSPSNSAVSPECRLCRRQHRLGSRGLVFRDVLQPRPMLLCRVTAVRRGENPRRIRRQTQGKSQAPPRR